jgi:Common central domain of tyrosinase
MAFIHITRRSAVAGIVGTIGAGAVTRLGPGEARAAGTVGKRKNIDALTDAELRAYEHAIKIVKDRSTANPDDPNGYKFWASLHDSFNESIHSGCPHYSEKFLPWHRRYLYDFEQLLQKTDPSVTAQVMIPYWDWSQPPTGNHFPKAFENSASPLFDRRLNLSPPPWDPNDLRNIIHESDWNLFAGKPDASNGFGGNPGSLENGPHNTLHGNISRDMRSPSTAVQDPIFWSFHAGIDLAWSRWQKLHASDGSAQPFADPAAIIWFRDRSYNVASTAKTSDFSYEYDFDFSADGPAPPAAIAAAAPAAAASRIISPPKRVVPLSSTGSAEKHASLTASGAGTFDRNTVLRLADVKVFDDKSYRLNVYLHPKDAAVAQETTGGARPPYLMRLVTIWQAHHPGAVEIFIRPSPEQLAQLNQGWVVTVKSQPLPSAEPETPSGAQPARTAAAGASLPDAAKLVGSVELQER